MTINTDWIEWAGGECPVPPMTMVQMKIRGDDVISSPTPAGFWSLVVDWWKHEESPAFGNTRDIIAYRIVKP